MADVPFDLILTLAQTVVKMGMNMKANKERCQRVAKRVMCLQELVQKLKDRDRDPRQISQVVRNALNQLSATLVNARDLMRKYHQSNTVKSFIFSSGHEDKFSKINEQLDDAFQILSGAMQIEHSEHLIEVLNVVAGKNKIRQTPPYPPSPLPGPTIQMPTTNSVQGLYPVSPVPASPVTSLTYPKPVPNLVPALTVTQAPNPPYPPAQRPAFNPNFLTVPSMPAPAPCAMPPGLVTMAPVRPVITMQGTTYGTVFANPIVRAPHSLVYAQTLPPQQVIMTLPPAPQVLTNPGVMSFIVNRPY